MRAKRKIIIILTVVLTVIGFLGIKIYNDLFYLNFVNKVENPETKEVFALFKHDYPFANPNFYILKFKEEENPEEFSFKTTYKKDFTQQEFNEFMDRVIFENYEEDGSKTSNPKVKILEDNFLVLERGGYYFGLYDIKENKLIVNKCCPFGEWGSQNIWSEKGTYYQGEVEKNERSDYGIWIEKHLHEPILNYIKENK